MDDEFYSGAEYRFPCSDGSGNTLALQAIQIDTDGNTGLFVSINDSETGDLSSVVVSIEHLTELHAAVNAALEAVAVNGIRLIAEAEEEAHAAAVRRLWSGVSGAEAAQNIKDGLAGLAARETL